MDYPWFRHGVMIPWFKKEALTHAIEPLCKSGLCRLPLPDGMSDEDRERLAVPRAVRVGERLWEADGAMPLYAPVNGEILRIEPNLTPLGDVPCLVIKSNGRDWLPAEKPLRRPQTNVIEAARRAAIVDEIDGLPLWEKLRDWKKAPCDVLVADGVEPEPYACSACAVLQEQGVQVLKGADLAAAATGISRRIIAVQTKRKQYMALRRRLGEDVVYGVPNYYPVIRYAPGPRTSTVARVGVQALLALYRAVNNGTPDITRVVTVSGDALLHSRNVRIPRGMAAAALLAHIGREDEPRYLIAGDALTGCAVTTDDWPVTPEITCLLGLMERPSPKRLACIGCGRCVKACHRDLLPFEIARQMENHHYDKLAALDPDRCDGCGTCSYVCPVGLDLSTCVLEAKAAGSSIVMRWGDSDGL